MWEQHPDDEMGSTAIASHHKEAIIGEQHPDDKMGLTAIASHHKEDYNMGSAANSTHHTAAIMWQQHPHYKTAFPAIATHLKGAILFYHHPTYPTCPTSSPAPILPHTCSTTLSTT